MISQLKITFLYCKNFKIQFYLRGKKYKQMSRGRIESDDDKIPF